MPPLYRPDGSEIMFIGRHPGAEYRDLYALDPATGNVRVIIAGSMTADIHGASWSPDGTHVAYGAFDRNADLVSTRTHVVAADGTGDILVDTHSDSIADGGNTWSNDGTRLIINRFYAGGDGDVVRSAVVPADGSNVGIEVDCPPGAPPADCTADWIWSPDDTVLLGAASDANNRPMPQFLADPLTGKIRPAPWTATGTPAWQRRAP
jgi:WD40 repeat protein